MRAISLKELTFLALTRNYATTAWFENSDCVLLGASQIKCFRSRFMWSVPAGYVTKSIPSVIQISPSPILPQKIKWGFWESSHFSSESAAPITDPSLSLRLENGLITETRCPLVRVQPVCDI